jgi:hypothetical protein
MGKEPHRVTGAKERDVRDHVAKEAARHGAGPDGRKAESPRDLKRLEWEITRTRRRLDEYVNELDRRRHRLLAVRRHPAAAAGVAAGVAALVVGGVVLARRRASTRRRAVRKSQSLREAWSRMLEHPERVASDGKSPWSRLAVAVAPILVKKIADAALKRR